MENDWGPNIVLNGETYQPVMQWRLTNSGPMDGPVRIQVGTMGGGDWYARHMAFGTWRFPDRQLTWNAVRALMSRHEGKWERDAVDSGPFEAVCRPDGSRVIYDTESDDCLYACWGKEKEGLWGAFSSAIDKGVILRGTETHTLFGGFIEMVGYDDPLDGTRRHAVLTAIDGGGDYRVVDYPQRPPAEAAYEDSVYANQDDEFPFKSCDIREIAIDRKSTPPPCLTVLPSGTVFDSGDREEYDNLWGLPLRSEWPRTGRPLVPPGAVCAMTAEPRDWGPAGVDVRDVTPAPWHEVDEELRPNALSLAALPDGRQLLASGHDGAAHLWSIGDGRNVRVMSGHSEWVLAVALMVLGDGRVVLATGGKDGLARIWSAREGDALQEIEGHRGPVNSVAWACPPGDVPWLVTGGDDATVRVWDVETARSLAVFEVGTRGIDLVWSVAAAVLADGHVCVAAATEGMDATTVHVWDATAKTRRHEFRFGCDEAKSGQPKVAVATLMDRSFRVAALLGSAVHVWDGHSGQVVRTLSMPEDVGWDRFGDVALAVLPDLRVIVAATNARATLVWDVESGTELTRLDHTGGRAQAVDLAVRPDGRVLLATGKQGDHPARVLRMDVGR
ncbi:WD40 repeat domain-containing protein [Streptosporangium vulgare]|uniref:WD40 repeat domain-containing protein n=1 Tax=Streptosporangium vulgare TaxID=46190 RepID=A0ABV5TTA7_9ACTN